MATASGDRSARSWCNEQSARFVHGRGQKSRAGVEIKLETTLKSIVLIMSGRSAAW